MVTCALDFAGKRDQTGERSRSRKGSQRSVFQVAFNRRSTPCASNRAARAWRGAFILADALVATVLLAGALTAVLSLASRALSAQRQGERLQIVAMLLDEQLNLVLMRGPDNYASAYLADGSCDAPFADYRYRLSFSGGTGGDPYEVSATILWTESGRPRSESITTLIAPRLGAEPDPERKPTETILRD